MQRIRSGDEVVVIAGKNKGSHGKVLKVNLDDDRVVIQGVNIVTKHVKPSRENPQGGIQKREAPIHLSNVALWNAAESRAVKVGFRSDDAGKKVRFDKKTGQTLD